MYINIYKFCFEIWRTHNGLIYLKYGKHNGLIYLKYGKHNGLIYFSFNSAISLIPIKKYFDVNRNALFFSLWINNCQKKINVLVLSLYFF